MPNLYDNIPASLKQRPNWVAWGIRDAPLKSPFNPARLLAGRPLPAKAGVRETWSSYQNAALCVARGLAQGIGYEFEGKSYLYFVLRTNTSDSFEQAAEPLHAVGDGKHVCEHFAL